MNFGLFISNVPYATKKAIYKLDVMVIKKLEMA